MIAFLVDLENKPGELARVAEAIAAKGVNITNVTGATCGSGGRVAMVTADADRTRSALEEAGIRAEEKEIVQTSMRDQPGTLAQAARRLADAGVNIEAIFPMGMTGGDITVGFVTDNAAKAKELISTASAGSM